MDDVYRAGRKLTVGDEQGRPLEPPTALTVVAIREFKAGLIARFDEIGDRNVADQFRGRTVLIASEEARPLAAGEYYLHDLVGLEARLPDGSLVGRVVQIYEGGASHVLGVDDGERERLIPFTRAIVREVDLDAGRIVIDPTPGLLAL